MAFADPFMQLRAELSAMQEQDRGLVVVRACELRTLLDQYDRTRARDDLGSGPTKAGVNFSEGAADAEDALNPLPIPGWRNNK